MRLYRNVMEYAASKDLMSSSAEGAKLELLDNAKDDSPLYTRGLEYRQRRFPRHSCSAEWDIWRPRIRKDPRALKGYMRRLRVLDTFEARAELQSRIFGLPSIDYCDGIALEMQRALCAKRETEIQEQYPLARVNLSVVPHGGKISAEYQRMKASFTITREALMDLPCVAVVDGGVILDARPAKDGVWFMRWAVMPGRKKEFSIVAGGYFEGELVMGYPHYNNTYLHVKDIQKIARHRAVTRALKG